MATKIPSSAITKPKTGRGGARPGAGRPKGALSVDPEYLRIPVQIRLPKYLVDWLYTQDKSLTKCIEYAVNRAKQNGMLYMR